ncbi:hypothetical protein G5C51_13405 [Streptomyces sp. A7024]|uniref:Uncharacterized protein n=1 Tax=Streptomyces coryli TaxID=1128680 RepID=A0A6G4TY05_9ACTN|nr:hypothetical protein [Streptomyces coryli]NGN64889.1 hypothetical protein [Streptomyces coryli]
MSELLAVANEIVPYLAAGAATVTTVAQTRIAEHVVNAGEAYLSDRLGSSGRRRDRDAAEQIRNLSDEARRALAEAICSWLLAGDLTAEALRREIERTDSGDRRGHGPSMSGGEVSAEGPGAVAIGVAGQANVYNWPSKSERHGTSHSDDEQ